MKTVKNILIIVVTTLITLYVSDLLRVSFEFLNSGSKWEYFLLFMVVFVPIYITIETAIKKFGLLSKVDN